MLKLINDLPLHVAGIHAYADVSKTEYATALVPLLNKVLTTNKKINFILVLETDIINFAPGMWCGDVKIGLKYFFKWRKIAVVTDQKSIPGYSDLFKFFIPGKFQHFPLDQLDIAVRWVSIK